jgi:glycosyltransferase involved in cell wall biosynthesis
MNYPTIEDLNKDISVLFFSHSSQLEGSERSMLELTRQLISDHHITCNVVLPNEGPLKSKLEEVGASTIIIDYHWWCDTRPFSNEDMNGWLNLGLENTLKIKSELSRINPDVVVTNTMVIPWGAMTAYLLGKPHIWFIREFGKLDHNLCFYPEFQTIIKIIQDASNLVVVNSNAVGNALFGKTHSKHIVTIYPPVNVPDIPQKTDKENYYKRKDTLKLIILGTVTESKGQLDAVLAVKELRRRKQDVELVVMGKGNPSYLQKITQIIEAENLGEYVNILDFKENPFPAVSQADVVLVCSRNEAFGRVVLEAMFLKKPVIGANSGGVPESVSEGFNGYLYEPGKYIQLADKIEYLARHREKIAELGENGYKFARENFTKEKSGDKLAELLWRTKGNANPYLSAFPRFVEEVMIETITRFISSRQALDLQISELNNNLKIKDAQINEVNVILQNITTQLQKLNTALQARDSQLNELRNGVQARDAQIKALESKLGEETAKTLSLQNQMQQSIVMQLQGKYQKIIEKLLPPGSKRRKGYELVLRGIRVILREGWRSFFRKTRSFLSNKILHLQDAFSRTNRYCRNYGFRKTISAIRMELNRKTQESTPEADIGNCITFFNLHPAYKSRLNELMKRDWPDPINRFASLLLSAQQAGKSGTTLIIDHSIGGGANIYSKRVIKERLDKGELILLLTYGVAAHLMKITALYKENKSDFSLRSLDDLVSLLEWVPCGEIFYNNSVTFTRPLELIRLVCRLKLDLACSLTVTIHDFYPICPTINLLKANGEFCGIPDLKTCRECLPGNPWVFMDAADRSGIDEWRNVWGNAIMQADTILCFSENSRTLLNRAYSVRPEQIKVRPHALPTHFTRKPRFDINGPLRIGVVGSIDHHKGADIVVQAAKLLARKAPEAAIIVIGTLEGNPGLDNLKLTGPYQPGDLPDLIEKYRVNVCLFPSTSPETFSYVCSELMELGMPLCSFNLGAQGERVARYKLGSVIPRIDPQTAVEAVIQLVERLKVEANRQGK